MFTKLLKEPLLHFGLIAAALFALNDMIWPEQALNNEQHTILVGQQQIAQYLQQQSGVYDQATLKQALESMPADKKRVLIDGYFREEALYREAVAMGLEQNDQAIRRRLIQSVSLMAEQIQTPATPSEADLKRYFDSNAAQYRIDAALSFTHIFIRQDNTTIALKELLDQLIANKVGRDQSGQYGDRFLYNRNYVERTPEFISSHFGSAFSAKIFNASTPTGIWLGPIQSEHGKHLIFIGQRSPAREATFDEVLAPVKTDFEREQAEAAREQGLTKITSQYRLKISRDLKAPGNNQ